MTVRRSAVVCFLMAGQVLVAGDVSYQQTTKITGGSITSMMKFAGAFSKDARKLGQPIVTTVAVKGNKMLRSSEDNGQITDLDAETITQIDKVKHEYSVVTFAQMKEAAERAMEKAKSEQAKAESNSTGSQPAKDSNVQVSFDTHARKTGASKQVSGFDTTEVILTVNVNGTDKSTGQQGALAIANDMWMAPAVPAYEAVREFERKLALKMGTAFTASPDLTAVVHQAQSSDELKAMANEMSQIQGVPVLQVMRMGMTTDGKPLPAASEAPLPQQSAAPSLRSALTGSLPFGGFGRKKKQPEAASPDASSTQGGEAQPQSAVLVESTTELGNFTEHVDPAVMEVPAGYKLVVAPGVQQ